VAEQLPENITTDIRPKTRQSQRRIWCARRAELAKFIDAEYLATR